MHDVYVEQPFYSRRIIYIVKIFDGESPSAKQRRAFFYFNMVELIKIETESTIDEREKFFFNLKENAGNEGVLLQTCNRLGFYPDTGNISYEIARCLFRVVAGLGSTITGEPAIVGDIKTLKITVNCVKAFHFDQLSNILERTGVLISAKSAPYFILRKVKLVEAKDIIENEVKIFLQKYVYEKEFSTHIN